jgi:4-hydroxybenzoate polyprenyltransferase
VIIKDKVRKSTSIRHWLRLIRWPNLVILAGIQGLAGMLICETRPLYLAGVIIMTASITAAGYIIHDTSDQVADRHNAKPNVVADGHIKPTHAMSFYWMCNALGALFALILAVQVSLHNLWIYAGLAIALWWYSKWMKGDPIAGNLCVSMLCASAVLLVCLDSGTLQTAPPQLIWLAVFAFLITWIREIIKDLEDVEGDITAGYQTLPIATRPAFARGVSIALTLVAICCLGIMSYTMDWGGWLKGLFLFVTTVLLLHYGVVRTLQARTTLQYHQISSALKIIMLTGTLCLII